MTFSVALFRLNSSYFDCRRVAGLKSAQVEKILKWREKNGRFVNRQQLLSVPGIGNKTFEQCAGWVEYLVVNLENLGGFGAGGPFIIISIFLALPLIG